jgi:hypothetical protein
VLLVPEPARPVVPGQQPVQWGVLATYRMQVATKPERSCSTSVCFEAVLLDAAP